MLAIPTYIQQQIPMSAIEGGTVLSFQYVIVRQIDAPPLPVVIFARDGFVVRRDIAQMKEPIGIQQCSLARRRLRIRRVTLIRWRRSARSESNDDDSSQNNADAPTNADFSVMHVSS